MPRAAVDFTNSEPRSIGGGRLPDVLTGLGIDAASWDQFTESPICLHVPEAMLALIEKGSWQSVLLRASWMQHHATGAPVRSLAASLHFPPEAWLKSLRATGRMKSVASRPHLAFQPRHASQLAAKLKE